MINFSLDGKMSHRESFENIYVGLWLRNLLIENPVPVYASGEWFVQHGVKYEDDLFGIICIEIVSYL